MTVEEPKVPVYHSEDLFYKNSFKVEAVGANNAVKEIDNENGIYKITSNGDSQGQNTVYINGFDKNKRYIVSFNVKLDSRSNNFKLKGTLDADHFTSDTDYYVNGNSVHQNWNSEVMKYKSGKNYKIDVIVDTKNTNGFDSKDSTKSGKSFTITLSDSSKLENTIEVSNISVREISKRADLTDVNFKEQYLPDIKNEEALIIGDEIKITITK